MTVSAHCSEATSCPSEEPCVKPSSRFELIDAIRGVAAIGIACFHIDRYGPIPEAVEPLLPRPIHWLLENSWAGVQFFFVIAGFVAAYSLRNVHITPAFVGNFTLRRLVRLGMPYWLVAILVAAFNYLAIRYCGDASLAGDVSWRRFLTQLLFLPDIVGYENLSAGMWFVAIDLQFGLLLLLLLSAASWLSHGRPAGSALDQLSLLAATLPLAVLSLFYWNLDSDNEMLVFYFFHLPAFGAITWWALEGRVSPLAFWGYAGLLGLGLATCWRPEVAIGLVAGIALYLAGRSGAIHYAGSRVLQHLGRISYSLFLIHYLVSWLVLSLGYWLTGTRPLAGLLWLALALVASLVAAEGMYLWVERPTSQLAQRLKTE